MLFVCGYDLLSSFPVSTSTAYSHVLVKLDGWSNTTVFLVLGKVPVCLGKVASTPHLHRDYTGPCLKPLFQADSGTDGEPSVACLCSHSSNELAFSV